MIDRVDVNSVLMQMRQVKEQIRAQHAPDVQETGGDRKISASERLAQQGQQMSEVSGDNTVPDFQSMFKNAIDNVNELQQTSGDLKTRMELGDPNVTLEQTMIASQKSSIAFEATVQVRNKVVEAYKEIMSMPV